MLIALCKMAAAAATSKSKREIKFTNSEKYDLVDIICNEGLCSSGDEPGEVMIVKLRSKSISNKEKSALYKRVSEELAERGHQARTPKGIKRMWNLLYAEYLKAKDIMKTKSGVKAMKNSPWVVTIADAMKRCEIEADLDDMVLNSQDLNFNMDSSGENLSSSNSDINVANDDGEDSGSEACDEVSEDLEENSKDTVPGKVKRAADAIARDKAVRRKSSKLSNKEAAMQSAESPASAIRDMGNKQEDRRKNEMLLWIEHESKERAKDRELHKLQMEFKERESKRNYELEIMRLRCCGGEAPQPVFPRQMPQFTQSSSSSNVDQDFFDYSQGQITSDPSSSGTYYKFP